MKGKMMKTWIMIMLILPASLLATGQPATPAEMTTAAAGAYAAGDYAGAAGLYEQVIAAGYESSELYFNLGNAYFKLNQIPSALLYYEKAALLDPRDENIRYNLELANSRIIDKIEPLPELFLRTWYRSARHLLSSDGWARLTILSFILFLAAAFLFLVSGSARIRRWAFWPGVGLLFIVFISLIFSIQNYRDYARSDTAIIFTPTVTVKSSPNDNSVDLFVVHEGTKVTITDRIDHWSEIRLANGNVGWLKTDTFRPI